MDPAAQESGTPPAGDDQAGLQALLDLPPAPAAFDPAQLPDSSPKALVTDLPSAPSEAITAMGPQVRRSIDALTGIARSAQLAEASWQPPTDAARQAAGTGNWGQTAQHLAELRTTVEHGLLDRRLEDFRAHVQGGFARLEPLGIRPDDWQAQVDAVERAAATSQVVLIDSALREYTAFVERHLPVEMLTGTDTPRSFDAGVEQLRRELTAAGDPAGRQRLQDELALHRELRRRLDRLAQGDPEASWRLRQALGQQEAARSADEEAQARQTLQEDQQHRERQRQLDAVREGTAHVDRDRRFEALREAAAPDPRGQELRQRVEEAATPKERERALGELAGHNQRTADERRLDALREVLAPEGGRPTPDVHQEQLIQQVVNAQTPQEARQASQELKDYTDRQIRAQQQQLTERLHTAADARTQAENAELRRRIDAVNGGVAQDPREAQLRQRLEEATTPQQQSRALGELAVHQQAQLQQRVEAAPAGQERAQALDAQAAFNNWTSAERRLAELRAALGPGRAPEADARHAQLLRQIENARTPQESHRAEQALKEHTDRRIRAQQQHLAQRQETAAVHDDLVQRLAALRGEDKQAAPAAGDPLPAAGDPLLERFAALRGKGTQLDPAETALLRRMETATSPEQARRAEQALREYLAGRQQQEQQREQLRLARVRSQEQEVTLLREEWTRQRRTGAGDDAGRTERWLEEARQRLAGLRTDDEHTAALRGELRQEVEAGELGSDRPGSGSGGRLERLVQEGLARRAGQEAERGRGQLEELRREPAGDAQEPTGEAEGRQDRPGMHRSRPGRPKAGRSRPGISRPAMPVTGPWTSWMRCRVCPVPGPTGSRTRPPPGPRTPPHPPATRPPRLRARPSLRTRSPHLRTRSPHLRAGPRSARTTRRPVSWPRWRTCPAPR